MHEKMDKPNKIESISIKQDSGYKINNNVFPIIKRKYIVVLPHFTLDGAAPKQVAKVYRYQRGIPRKKKNNYVYIVKTGHKWYPNESVMEQLFTDIGKCLELKMADTFIAVISNQIKILSKYFLRKGTKLVKGIEIYSEYFGGGKENKQLFEEIEEENLSRELITVQLTYNVLEKKYQKDYQNIFNQYVKLLIFDALIGNNDRHFYNWGIIEKISDSNSRVQFSPIYDTARGLFWNIPEKNLEKYMDEMNFEKYIDKCTAKISYGGDKKENHFALIRMIYENKEKYQLVQDIFSCVVSKTKLERAIEMIDDKYYYLSDTRKELIKKCLKRRFEKLSDIVKE